MAVFLAAAAEASGMAILLCYDPASDGQAKNPTT